MNTSAVESEPRVTVVRTGRCSEGDVGDVTLRRLSCPFNCSPLYRHYGIAKLLQLLASIVAALCLLSSLFQDQHKTMDLPMHWRLEVLLLLSLASIIFSMLFLCLYTLKASQRHCPLDLHRVDLTLSCLLILAFLCLSGFLLDVALYYNANYPNWKAIQIFDSCVFGFACAAAYSYGAIFLWRIVYGVGFQFRSRRLHNESHSQIVQSIDEDAIVKTPNENTPV